PLAKRPDHLRPRGTPPDSRPPDAVHGFRPAALALSDPRHRDLAALGHVRPEAEDRGDPRLREFALLPAAPERETGRLRAFALLATARRGPPQGRGQYDGLGLVAPGGRPQGH